MGQRSRCGGPRPGEAGAGWSVDRIRASGGGNRKPTEDGERRLRPDREPGRYAALYPDPPGPPARAGGPRVAPGVVSRSAPAYIALRATQASLPVHRKPRGAQSPPAPGCRGPGSAAIAALPGPRHGRRFAPIAGARATPGLRTPSGCSGLDVGGGPPRCGLLTASHVPAWSSPAALRPARRQPHL